MTNTLYTQTTAPTPYAITPVPGANWLFELTWQGRPVDTFYSYVEAEDAIPAHAALWEADCACGDIHVLTPDEQWEEESGVIAIQSIAMLDTCLGAPHSDGEAGCVLVELESRGIYVEPVSCAFCGRTHLVRKAGR